MRDHKAEWRFQHPYRTRGTGMGTQGLRRGGHLGEPSFLLVGILRCFSLGVKGKQKQTGSGRGFSSALTHLNQQTKQPRVSVFVAFTLPWDETVINTRNKMFRTSDDDKFYREKRAGKGWVQGGMQFCLSEKITLGHQWKEVKGARRADVWGKITAPAFCSSLSI